MSWHKLLQVFLGLAFFVEGFLMTMHKKHEPFDAMVHFLLGTLQWACAAFILLQLWAPHSLWLSLGRAASCLMQGMWLWQVRAQNTRTAIGVSSVAFVAFNQCWHGVEG